MHPRMRRWQTRPTRPRRVSFDAAKAEQCRANAQSRDVYVRRRGTPCSDAVQPIEATHQVHEGHEQHEQIPDMLM
eukprot:4177053-Pleurochrysis_carterae.AAC.1